MNGVLFNFIVLLVQLFYLFRNQTADFQLSMELIAVPNSVYFRKRVNFIPKECLVEYVRLNLSLPPYQYDHILFYDRSTFRNLQTFILNKKGIANYFKPYYDGYEIDLNRNCWEFSASYVHMKNMFVCNSATYTMYDMTYIYLENDWKLNWIRTNSEGDVVGSYNDVIAVGHHASGIFGHMLDDVLIPILMLPQDIIDKSFIAVTYETYKYANLFNVIGIFPERVHFMNKSQWIFACNLYTFVDPTLHISHYGLLSNRFSQKMRKYYAVDKIVPTNYVISYRTTNRNITNLYQVYLEMKMLFPNRPFIYYADELSIENSSKVYASALLLFGPTGSNMYKHYFLKEKSVIIIALGTHLDPTVGIGAGAHDIFTIYVVLPGMEQFGTNPGFLKIDIARRLFTEAIYCVDHHHFSTKTLP